MNNYSDENNTCGRCGAQFQGIKCPQCGLVMCKNIIDDMNLKKDMLNSAIKLLVDQGKLSKEDNINNAIVSFYYILADKDKENDNVVAAFKIITSIHEFYFSFTHSKLQFLLSGKEELYDSEFNNVRKIHKIDVNDSNKNDYEFPIMSVTNFELVECPHCHTLINPYSILCSNCHLHIANDYPSYYQDFTFNVSFGNNEPYNITFVVPNNLKVADNGSGGYFTLMDEVGPKFISYRFFDRSVFDSSNDKLVGERKEEIYLGKQLKSEYIQKENGNILFTSEVKFADNLYAIMEYQINNANFVYYYNEQDIKRYLAILYCVVINGNGYVDKTFDETNNNSSISGTNTNGNKKSLSSIIGIVILIAIIAGVIILFGGKKEAKMVLHPFDKLIIRIPNNYKEHSRLDLFSTSTLDFDNEKCSVQLKKRTKFQTYNFDTATYDENNYTKEELYSDITLEEKTIDGQIWYYHSPQNGNYIYDYIEKNINYRVEINSKDDDYCRVNDIIDSLMIK